MLNVRAWVLRLAAGLAAACHMLVLVAVPEPGQGGLRGLSGKLSGSWESDLFSYTNEASGEDAASRMQADLKVAYSDAWNERWEFKLVGRLRWDSESYTDAAFAFLEDGDECHAATVDELLLQYHADAYTLSVGKQFLNWSFGDQHMPCDSINPYDISDVPTLEKIAVPAASWYHYGGLFDLEAFLVPVFTPARLPAADSRWFPDRSSVEAEFAAILGFEPTLEFGGRDLPPHSMRHVQGGVRLNSSNLFSGWDLVLSYYHGIEPVGTYAVDVRPPVVQLTQVFTPFHEFGFGVLTTYDVWEFHAEAVLQVPEDEDMEDNYWEYVLGLNYTAYHWFAGVHEETRTSLEYAREHLVDGRRQSLQHLDLNHYTRPFKNSVIAACVFQFNMDTECSLLSL